MTVNVKGGEGGSRADVVGDTTSFVFITDGRPFCVRVLIPSTIVCFFTLLLQMNVICVIRNTLACPKE